MFKRVYMTLLSNTAYLPGTLILYHSLQATKPKYPLIVLITPALPEDSKQMLERSGIETLLIDRFAPPVNRFDPSKTFARFADIWTKVGVFGLEQFEKIVFLDSDMLVLKNIDELFDLPITTNQVAAVYACTCNPFKIQFYPKDWIPANCGYSQPNYPECLKEPRDSSIPRPRTHSLLNSGMFLCRPSKELLGRMRKMLDTSPLVPTWKFCDQDLIGNFFGGGGSKDPSDWGEITKEELGDQWLPVPYYFNALKPLRKTHASFWRDEDIRVVHYILDDKPWKDRPTDDESYEEVKRWWWKSYETFVEDLRCTGRHDDISFVEGLVGEKILG
ncbi:hypothetical protein FRC14_003237 [Serendipita sp. 396]|nr:hypothetical protein FRC14_003237 [Serendipita sp. 396]KAG8872720.1 hypothetical protein FRC20_009132 [Serendipita sp. 405]